MTRPILNANGDDTIVASLQGMSLPRVIAGPVGPFAVAIYATRPDDLKRTPPNALEVIQILQGVILMSVQMILKAKAMKEAE